MVVFCQKDRTIATMKWVNKIWYVHVVECYPVLKEKEVLTPAMTYMSLEDIC